MDFYQKTIALALVQSGHSPLRAFFIMQKCGALLPPKKRSPIGGHTVEDRDSSLRLEIIEEIKNISSQQMLVDGCILERQDGGFLLHSGDGTKIVSKEFLERCNPKWRLKLQDAMENWDQNAHDRKLQETER